MSKPFVNCWEIMRIMSNNIRILLLTAIVGATVLIVSSPSFAQTKVGVSIGSQYDMYAPPQCTVPCKDEFVLPAFARRLSLAGPDGDFETELTRSTFLNTLEDWREYLENYRLSIEDKQFIAEDWKKANVIYLTEIGRYEQFFESYRNAISMDRSGKIIYGVREFASR